MNIHLYTFVYNEADILPFFFRHYEEYVDRFFVYDNYSTDKIKQVVKDRKDTEYLLFDTDNKFDELAMNRLKNNEWKKSRGEADVVIVCDADEFLYSTNSTINTNQMLEDLIQEASILIPEGYHMISGDFSFDNEPENQQIVDVVKKGSRAPLMDKPIIFNPDKIVETNFKLGSHVAMPEGEIKIGRDKDFKLLHYKRLNLHYALAKKNMLNRRVPKEFKSRGISIHYSKSDKEYEDEYIQLLEKAKQVIPDKTENKTN